MPKVMPNESPYGGNGGGRSRRRGPRVTTALSEINVVPLVDVMLVLLIIFMVAAPMMQQGLDVKLPQSRRAPALQVETPVYVTVPLSFARNRLVQLGNESIRLDVLDERVRQELRTRDKKEVFLRSDGQVTMQQVMEVMDRLKDGGVQNVGLMSRAPDRPTR
jgi:biopolymer transport protein TolR